MHSRSRTIIFIGLILVLLGSFIVLGWGIHSKDTPFYSDVTSFDTDVTSFAQEHTSEAFAPIMLFMTYLANTEVIITVMVVLLIILMFVNEELLAGFFLGGLAIGASLSTYFKNTLKRSRPLESLYEITTHGYAFPSGHALISMVFYGFLGYCLMHIAYKRWQKIVIMFITIGAIFLIGYSRVALGAHWASDVLGGWLLGGVLLSILIFLFDMSERKFVYRARIPKGIILISILGVLIGLGFSIGYFYVTHGG